MPEFALGREQVEDIDRTLTDLDERGSDVELRFTNHWADEGDNAALLAAALMGPLSDRHVFVNAEDEDAVDGLLRFGVATALSRREAHLTTFVGPAARLDTPTLRLLWTPGSRGTTQAMFRPDDDSDAVDSYGPLHATFVNPHLSSGADGHPDVVFLVRRWLTRRLRHDHGMSSHEVEGVVAAVGLVVDELVSNVQEHASGGGLTDPDCLMRLSIKAREQVRISILDTGVGLDASLREKVASDVPAECRIPKLLAGVLPGWDAGRGIGLPRVASVVSAHAGRLSVASEALRVVREDDTTAARSDAFPLQGTVIDCTIPTAASPV